MCESSWKERLTYFLMWIGMVAIMMFAVSCNAITPDRFGIGMSEGNMNAFGKSNRIRTLNLEKELLIQEIAIDKVIKNIDVSLGYKKSQMECTPAEREVDGMWPKRLTNQYS